MLYLRILAFVFMAAGFLTVFAARSIVEKYNLDKNTKCDFEEEMSEQEIESYKYNKAVVNIKMLGMLIALPGLVLIVVLFR